MVQGSSTTVHDSPYGYNRCIITPPLNAAACFVRCPSTIGHRPFSRLLQLVAENSALEDGLYYLDVGVTDGAITVDVFLREVRKLARKQFVARATTKKVNGALTMK